MSKQIRTPEPTDLSALRRIATARPLDDRDYAETFDGDDELAPESDFEARRRIAQRLGAGKITCENDWLRHELRAVRLMLGARKGENSLDAAERVMAELQLCRNAETLNVRLARQRDKALEAAERMRAKVEAVRGVLKSAIPEHAGFVIDRLKLQAQPSE